MFKHGSPYFFKTVFSANIGKFFFYIVPFICLFRQHVLGSLRCICQHFLIPPQKNCYFFWISFDPACLYIPCNWTHWAPVPVCSRQDNTFCLSRRRPKPRYSVFLPLSLCYIRSACCPCSSPHFPKLRPYASDGKGNMACIQPGTAFPFLQPAYPALRFHGRSDNQGFFDEP